MEAWIETQAKEAGAEALIVGISGGVDSAVTAAICSRTSLPVVGVIMPCQSSPNAILRAEEVVRVFNLKRHYVNLETSFESITSQLPEPMQKNTCHGALRSLRAPTS